MARLSRLWTVVVAGTVTAFPVVLGVVSPASAATLPACSVSGATGAGSPGTTVNVAAPSGTTDMSTTINNAIAQGGKVVLGAGTYYISHPITVRSGVDFVGQGAGSTTIKATTALGSGSLVQTSGNSNITIEAMTVDQNGSAQSTRSLGNYLLDVGGGKNVIVQNVATRNPSTYSLVAHNNVSNFCFRNNDVRNTNSSGNFPNLDGIHTTRAQYGDILNNYVDQMSGGSTGGDDGIALQVETCGSGCGDTGSSGHIAVSGNVVRGGATAGDFDFAISGGFTLSNVTISNNEFWGGPDGIRDANFGGGGALSNVTMTNNYSHNHAATAQQSGLPKRGYTLPYNTGITQSSITVNGFKWCSDAGGAPVPASGTSNGVTASNVTSYTGCTNAPNITAIDSAAGTGATGSGGTTSSPTTATVTVGSVTSSSIAVSWKLNVGTDGANGATVGRDGTSTDRSTPGWTSSVTSGTTGSLTFTALNPNTTYHITVQPYAGSAAVGTPATVTVTTAA